jgi:hypothetical protein
MRVLLLGGMSFEGGLLEAEGFDLIGREDLLGGDWGGAVAGVDELHDAGGGEGGKEGKFAQAVGGLDLTGLDIEALALEGPEQLLDVPALAIPFDDLLGLCSGVDDAGGQQPPMQRRLWARTRAAFADVDDIESHALGQRCTLLAQPVRAHQLDFAEAQLELRAARRAARLSGYFQLVTVGNRQLVAGGKQRSAAAQRAVLRGACEQVQVGRTRPRPLS